MPQTKVTLEDIAIRAGVSTAAVSQALSGKGALSLATRQKIMQMVEDLSYQPDKVAQNLARRRASQADGKRIEGSKRKNLPPPGIMVFYNLPELSEVVHLEIQQMEEEGFDVSRQREELLAAQKPSKQKLYQLYSQVISAPLQPDWRYHEPNTLTEIQQQRPEKLPVYSSSISTSTLYDRIHGAWLGRTAGCVLGKPLQAGWSRQKITQYLRLAKSYPLRGYLPRLLPPPPGFEFEPETSGCFLGEIHGAPQDDDTDFSILALHILETYGVDFTIRDVATEWLSHLAYFGVYTTERAVYRNLVWNTHPEEAATFANPEREFAGARTRADLYGYICPGRPVQAASLAYKDAALSHTKNGLYSAMFMAALISWSFVCPDLEQAVQVGLSAIPHNCRLAESVQMVLTAYQNGLDWESAYDQILLRCGGYSPIHSINNTAWVVLSILFSKGDFTQALSLAVTCGMDTGSNAGSVGSVLGAFLGRSTLPDHWTEPLNNQLFTAVAGFRESNLAELASRTTAIAQRTLIQPPFVE